MTYHYVLDALGDPTRRQIIDILASGPLPVVSIADRLPVSRPAVSQHLKILLEAGIVEMATEGRRHLYQLRHEGFGVVSDYIEQLWDLPLKRFAEAAKRKSELRSEGNDAAEQE